MIGNRSIKKILKAATLRQHYIALFNMGRLYPRFFENLWRYLTAKGSYPYQITVRTPVGPVSMQLYSHHDLLTVNEIFCRQDYFADASLRHVIDLGSNIGISALYFLTRNADSNCILYEPNPRNVERLQQNLRGYEGRYTLIQCAVSDQAGQLEFGVEPTGRYGGIGMKTGESIVVQCVHINDVLKEALQKASRIDVLKIDTEGVEIQTVNAISPEILPRISAIYLEAWPTGEMLPGVFDNRQYGGVRQLTRKRSAQ